MRAACQHEQQSIARAMAAATQHSAPRRQKSDMHSVVRHQEAPPRPRPSASPAVALAAAGGAVVVASRRDASGPGRRRITLLGLCQALPLPRQRLGREATRQRKGAESQENNRGAQRFGCGRPQTILQQNQKLSGWR